MYFFFLICTKILMSDVLNDINMRYKKISPIDLYSFPVMHYSL